MRTAFKEWAVVVDALGRGQQIVILRKGGIHEAAGGFRPKHHRFWLFPTARHQQRDSVVPAARKQFDERNRSTTASDQVGIQFLAELSKAVEIASLEAALALRGQHIWTDETIRSRYEWGGRQQIHALLVRVHRLPQAACLPMKPSYSGCKSWIELAEEPSERELEPVLTDDAFASRLARVEECLREHAMTT